EAIAVVVVEFITMPVTFGNLLSSVSPGRFGGSLQYAGISPQSHGASFISHGFLGLHDVNHQLLAAFVKFLAVGLLQIQHIAGELNRRHLHTKTNPKERLAVHAAIVDRGNLALYAAPSKPPRNDDAIKRVKNLLDVRIVQSRSID